jgi:hypothetical protein
MAKVNKGYEDHFYSGMIDGKLIKGKLTDFDEETLDLIAGATPGQRMITPSGKPTVKAIEDKNPPAKPEPPANK